MSIEFSMLEVYNEMVRDLLPATAQEKKGKGKAAKPPPPPPKGLEIRELGGKGKVVYVAGLRSYEVATGKEMNDLLELAMKNRTLGEMGLDARSKETP